MAKCKAVTGSAVKGRRHKVIESNQSSHRLGMYTFRWRASGDQHPREKSAGRWRVSAAAQPHPCRLQHRSAAARWSRRPRNTGLATQSSTTGGAVCRSVSSPTYASSKSQRLASAAVAARPTRITDHVGLRVQSHQTTDHAPRALLATAMSPGSRQLYVGPYVCMYACMYVCMYV